MFLPLGLKLEVFSHVLMLEEKISVAEEALGKGRSHDEVADVDPSAAWGRDCVNLIEKGAFRNLGELLLEVLFEVIIVVLCEGGLEYELEGELHVGSFYAILTILSEVRETNVLGHGGCSGELLDNHL